jgi:hypothetical protein
VAVSIHGPSSLPTKVRNVVLFTEIVESVRDALVPSLELEENDNDVPDLTVGAASVDWPVRPGGVILLLAGLGFFFFTILVGIPDK